MSIFVAGRFGPFEVPGVQMDHHQVTSSGAEEPVVWVSVPTPVSVGQVATLLYDTLDDQETVSSSPAELRRVLAGLVAGGGWIEISEAEWRTEQHRREAREPGAEEHWERCQRRARELATEVAAKYQEETATTGGKTGTEAGAEVPAQQRRASASTATQEDDDRHSETSEVEQAAPEHPERPRADLPGPSDPEVAAGAGAKTYRGAVNRTARAVAGAVSVTRAQAAARWQAEDARAAVWSRPDQLGNGDVDGSGVAL